jgi:hypothetical protein
MDGFAFFVYFVVSSALLWFDGARGRAAEQWEMDGWRGF